MSERTVIDVKTAALAFRDAAAHRRNLETRLEHLKRRREDLLTAPISPQAAAEVLYAAIDARVERAEKHLGHELKSIRYSHGRYWRTDRSRMDRGVDFLVTGPPGNREIDIDAVHCLLGDALKARIRALADADDSDPDTLPLEEREVASRALDDQIEALEADLGVLTRELDEALEEAV